MKAPGRALRLAGWSTLAAGGVWAVRHRREQRLVRAGELAPVTAITATAPPRREGSLSRRLAGWIPDRPTTPLGQAVAAVWAAPLTAAGVLVAASARSWPRWDDEHGCWLAVTNGADLATRLRLVATDANAMGQVVVSRLERPSQALLAHEAAHVRQAERLGVLLPVLYAWLGARYGYRHHPIERAARAAARRLVTGSA